MLVQFPDPNIPRSATVFCESAAEGPVMFAELQAEVRARARAARIRRVAFMVVPLWSVGGEADVVRRETTYTARGLRAHMRRTSPRSFTDSE